LILKSNIGARAVILVLRMRYIKTKNLQKMQVFSGCS